MSPPGRPKGEYRSAQHEGGPVSPPGRPKGEYRSAQHEGGPVTALRLLVSVRSVDEALCAADAGVDLIDLKEPAAGALGGLPITTVRAVVAALRERGGTGLVSATIGDVPMSAQALVLERVHAVAACGVDYVKVGIACDAAAPAVLRALAASGWLVVPVFIADQGLDAALVAQAAGLGFPALMVDTADKRAGSLFDVIEQAPLRRFMATARAAGALAGLAGSLQRRDLPMLRALAPDFAGFRSAVCAGDRAGALDPQRLLALRAELHAVAMAG